MISGHGVTKEQEHAGVLDRGDRSWGLLGHTLEEGRVMNVGGVFSPREELALRSLKVVPSLVSSQSVRVEIGEEFRSDDSSDNLSDFVSCGPEVSEHNRVALRISTDWLNFEVDVDGASKCVGDNERR